MTVTAPTLVSPAPAEPLGAEKFASLMEAAGVAAGSPLAVAVSGGADSMALALLAGEWAVSASGNSEIHFLTFDHGLRAESADEAKQTGAWLAARALNHHILRWPQAESKPASDVQAVARRVRFKALEDWCVAHSLPVLLLAHHLEDQAETLLMRLARGSGVDGLAAMAAVAPPLTRRGTPRLVRPLLNTPKARLVATLQARGQQWVEDPSNEDRAYLRVQARELLRDLPLDGLTPERLAATARRMARVRALLDEETAKLLRASVVMEEAGYARLDAGLLNQAHEEIGLRVLSRLIASIGGRAYPPRLEGIERLMNDLRSGDFAGATLAGCLFAPTGDGAVLVAREAGTIKDTREIAPGETIHWDGRFDVKTGTSGIVAALGEDGWRELLAAAPDVKKSPNPHAARLALPALRVDGEIRSVPHLDYIAAGYDGLSARFSPLRPLYPDESNGYPDGGEGES